MSKRSCITISKNGKLRIFFFLTTEHYMVGIYTHLYTLISIFFFIKLFELHNSFIFLFQPTKLSVFTANSCEYIDKHDKCFDGSHYS